jgi:hypothetical protein
MTPVGHLEVPRINKSHYFVWFKYSNLHPQREREKNALIAMAEWTAGKYDLGRSPTERHDCDSIKKKSTTLKFTASRHRILVALVGEEPLRTEGSTSRQLFFLVELQSRRLGGRTALDMYYENLLLILRSFINLCFI